MVGVGSSAPLTESVGMQNQGYFASCALEEWGQSVKMIKVPVTQNDGLYILNAMHQGSER